MQQRRRYPLFTADSSLYTCLADEITGTGQFRIPTLVLFFISEAVVSSLPLVYHGLIRHTFLDFPDGVLSFSFIAAFYGNTTGFSAVFRNLCCFTARAAYDHALFSFRVWRWPTSFVEATADL
jgi:hypothetical protein